MNLDNLKIAVLGCGNMASPIVKAIALEFGDVEFHTYTPSGSKSVSLAADINGNHHDVLRTIPRVDYWLIACKPQQLEQLVQDLGEDFKEQNIISILASTNIQTLKLSFSTKKIIRIMPNTPALYGQGISLYLSSSEISETENLQIKHLFGACGELIEVANEREFDELTVFSGSGPAYIFRFALGYYKKMIQMGYSQDLSRKLLNQLFLGSAVLMDNSLDDLQTMVDNVTSKGGVTIEAVNILEENRLDESIGTSIDSAIRRNKQIAQE